VQPITHAASLDAMWRTSSAYAVLCAWAHNGLFTALAEGPRPLAELPGDDRALDVAARVLGHVGLLVGHGGRWGLSVTGKQLFDEGALNLGPGLRTFGDWSRLDRILRDGGPALDEDGSSRVTEGGVREHDPDNARQFMNMLHRRSADSAPETVRWMTPHLAPAAHVLDVGGGHGRYAEHLLDAGFRTTVLDRPVCIELARERYGDRLGYLEADFLEDPLGGPYDAALLSNIVHGLGPDEIVTLLRNLHQSLAPGALLVIKDMFLDESRVQPEAGVIFALTMLMFTRNGDSYDRDQLDSFLGQAGFRRQAVVDVTDQRFSLLLARREG
jgi:SAM-dependent methyltransferase